MKLIVVRSISNMSIEEGLEEIKNTAVPNSSITIKRKECHQCEGTYIL